MYKTADFITLSPQDYLFYIGKPVVVVMTEKGAAEGTEPDIIVVSGRVISIQASTATQKAAILFESGAEPTATSWDLDQYDVSVGWHLEPEYDYRIAQFVQ